MNKRSLNIFHLLEIIILVSLLGFELYWRFKVGMMRFFDVDEFTHLHWAAAMVHGAKPYIDFYTIFTPGILLVFGASFWVFGADVSVFLAARVVALLICFLIFAAVGILFGLLRSRRYVLIPVILLAFLPMPYDKYFELRPDNLATLLGLIGVILQVWALLHSQHKKAIWAWAIAGFAYGCSIIVLVKMLPFVGAGGLVAILNWRDRKKLLYFVAGLAIPIIIFAVWAVSLGNLSLVIYSLTRMPFESNMGNIYVMEPHLFFFPNVSFYGGWGITTALILNHAIWLTGAIMGVYRFFTPYITANGDRKKVLAEFLVSLIFVLSVVGYVNFFPLKHSQYLIPIAIFIAFYAADILEIIFRKTEQHWGIIPVILFLCAGGYVLGQQTIHVNQGKLLTSNTVQLQQLQRLKTMIPAPSEVFDLEGRMIYWRDPYYICCLPMGSFVQFLSRPPIPLRQVLEAKKVPYIFQGDSSRMFDLSAEDQQYIRANYTPAEGWGDALWTRKTK